MRKAKRFLASLLAVVLAAGSLPAEKSLAAAEDVSGKTGESTEKLTEAAWDSQIYSTDYFGEQLTQEAEKVFYAALKTMYNNGAFLEGTVSCEIQVGNEEGMLPEALLNAYRNGDASLLQMFQNASNAFMLDRNDLFYVDWTKLSVRVGQKNGQWSVHVGNGAYKNLYLERSEYRDAEKIRTDIDRMNAKITEISEAAKAYKTREEQIGYVHDTLIAQIEYVYRGTTKIPGDTAAGGLVYGKAWCEGYARAFKAVMDKMDIPCVLVGGTGLPEAAQNGESLISPDVEAHMWNYVCMNDGKWYAVDVTYDDPITQKPGDAIRRSCLLKGAGEFSARHVESGQFSQGGRSFQYPVISEGNVGEGDGNGEGLKIDVSYYDAYNGGTWTSYTVMQPTYTLADGEKLVGKNIDGEGHYLYYKIRYEDSNGEKYTGYGDEWSSTKNILEHSGDVAGLTTKAYCVEYPQGEETITQVGYQFAIADKAPSSDFASLNRLPADATILDTSEVIYFRDRYQDIRILKPSIIERTPDTFSYITESSTHIKYVYDMPLKLAEGYSEASLKVSTSLSGPTCRVENLTWKNTTRTGFNGKVSDCCEVEFDFYPDTSYNYSGTTYTFELDGLVSLANDSKPRAGSITWQSDKVNKYPCPYMPAPSEMLMSMYPRLSNTKYSPELFTDPLGNGLAGTNNYDLNLTLIASKPSDGEQQKIEDALEGAGVQAAANTAVFSLDLSMSCLSMRTMLNSKLNEGKTKICMALPYPEGFDSRKLTGVTFEAYHFRKDENGNYVPEKLICNATDTGIWVIADSFSPFAVVAVDKDRHQSDGKMISAVANAEMADISVTRNPSVGEETLFPEIMELKEGESCTYTITPKEGYVLEQVIWNGAEQEAAPQEDGSYTVTYSWDDLTEENNSLQVNFCAADVLQAEESNGFTAENPVRFTAGMANQNGQAVLAEAAGEDNFHAVQMEFGKTIAAEMENITHVKLNAADLKMQNGTTSTLTLTEGSAAEGTTWTSSHEEVATVDENGTVTAVSVGVSYITVTNANGAATCKVEVLGEDVVIVEVSGISLSPAEVFMKVGDAPAALAVSVLPENATNTELNWENSNPDIAMLQHGQITALKPGTTTLTATASNGRSASCTVTVTENTVPVERVTLSSDALSLEVGTTGTLTATVVPDNATDAAVNWSSSDTNVATVDQNGTVTAAGAGSAVITAAAGGKTATCNVTVTAKVSYVSVTFKIGEKTVDVREVVRGGSLKDSEIPSIPQKEGYTQTAPYWDVTDFSNITEDKVVNAVYTINTYTVTFLANGKEVSKKTVNHGSTLTDIPEVPVKEGYTQTAPYWDVTDFSNITEDKVVNAVYTINTYTVDLSSAEIPDGCTLEAVSGTEVTHGSDFVFKVNVQEGYTKQENFCVKVNDKTLTPAEGGNYAIKVTGEVNIKVTGAADVTAPEAEIILGTSSWKEFISKITFGIFFKETQTVTIQTSDAGSGVNTVQYHLAEEALSLETVIALTDWKDYSAAFSIKPDSRYVVYAKVTDNAGNIKYISSDGIVLDSVAPSIAGIENGKAYYGDTSFRVAADDISRVTVDGIEVELSDTGAYTIQADNVAHIVTAVDLAGNQTEYTITVYKKYTVTFLADGEKVTEKEVGYGNALTEIPEVPAKEGYDQTAPKWDVEDFSNITGDLVVNAVYTINTYKVTFQADGKKVEEKNVEHGKALMEIPEVPAKAGYDQTAPKWDVEDFSNITGDLVVNAVYTINTYKVTFQADGKKVEEKNVEHGNALTEIPEVPAKAGYDQTAPKWDVEDFSSITGDLVVNAVYTINSYKADITVPAGTVGYQIEAVGNTVIKYGSDFTFRITLADGYEASADYCVTVNGKTVTPNEDGSYTVKNVQGVPEIRVTGVVVVPEKNDTIIKAGNYYYEIVSGKNRTVRVAGIKNTKQSKITIRNQVKIGGQVYMVTSVAENAFKNCVKVKSVTIGKNVRVIGKSAFEGCRKLKKVTVKGSGLRQIQANAFKNCSRLTKIRIQSSKLRKAGKNAFRNINKKAVIYVPAARYKKYVKLLKGKGMPKTVKIKK